MIETHCHLTFDTLLAQIDQVLARATAAGVDRLITVSTTPQDAEAAHQLADCDRRIFTTAGVHPHEAANWTDRSELDAYLRRYAGHDRLVALGEMGLDAYYPDPPMDTQRRLLQWQLQVASELDRQLPVIIHCREAADATLAILRNSRIDPARFVFHCFTGSNHDLDQILAFGAMVSFTGIVTFGNARALAQSALRVPLDRLMIETDAPYLTPEPHRKVRPNEPCYLPCVARFLADQRQTGETAFIDAVDANAVRFFRLPDAASRSG